MRLCPLIFRTLTSISPFLSLLLLPLHYRSPPPLPRSSTPTVIEKYAENTHSAWSITPDAPGSVLSQDQMIPRLEYVIQQERWGGLERPEGIWRGRLLVSQKDTLCWVLFLPFNQRRVWSCPRSIDITPDGIKAIVTLSSGDMRRSLNVLQVRKNLLPVCS